MSFNKEQTEHMRDLDAMPPNTRCWCGWRPLNTCPHCPRDATCEQKMAAACPSCGNAPLVPGGSLIHIVRCPATKAP
jgi:hypothetical protein